MTSRAWLILVSFAVALGIIVPAQAATITPGASSSSGPVCLYEGGGTECLTTHGVNNQLTIQSSPGYATFQIIVTTDHVNGYPVLAFEDAHGNCVRCVNCNDV